MEKKKKMSFDELVNTDTGKVPSYSSLSSVRYGTKLQYRTRVP
jgi:hypothetical protein